MSSPCVPASSQTAPSTSAVHSSSIGGSSPATFAPAACPQYVQRSPSLPARPSVGGSQVGDGAASSRTLKEPAKVSPTVSAKKRASPGWKRPRSASSANKSAPADATPSSASAAPSAPVSSTSSPSQEATKPAPPLSSPKRQRPSEPAAKPLPALYQHCPPADLVILISDMLLELVGLNDRIPLSGSQLTRFHSRAPPTISIPDYLNRLTVHATLQPSIMLSMVYYIDILSTHYPPFVVSSLTVHRFLITAATVASKGLCDTFLTNGYYAKVGGVSVMELNMLELEFLVRVGWRIVPKPETLGDYYRSLVARLSGRYRIEDDKGG